MSGPDGPDRADASAPTPPPYSPPPYPVTPPGAGYGMPPVRPSTGTVSWAMGFLQFVPGIGLPLAGIVMASVYRSVSRGGEVARANARGAANWGLTVIAGIVVSILLSIVIHASTGGARGFFPTGIGVLVIIAIAVTHLIVTIVGTVRASGGRVLNVPFAIPFIRR